MTGVCLNDCHCHGHSFDKQLKSITLCFLLLCVYIIDTQTGAYREIYLKGGPELCARKNINESIVFRFLDIKSGEGGGATNRRPSQSTAAAVRYTTRATSMPLRKSGGSSSLGSF